MNKKLKGKVILILGGQGTIGAAIAELLAHAGAVVCAHGRSGEFRADVRKEIQTEKLIKKIVKNYGRLDAVINALAAPLRLAPIHEKNWPDFLEHFNVQLKAGVEVLKYTVPEMKKQGSGHFINIISTVVQGEPPKSYADYITAKYALLGFSKCLASELKPSNIFVNCISPDFVKTKLTAVFPEKLGEILASRNLSRRLTIPADVARVVLWLLTHEKTKTGKHILIQGGQIIK